ncbi:MAG: hypothetical protein KAY24_08795 [Candidatus Eisenbacteria sp.]|nr:hypothetical protein [Candidatus Eisenbacteria bacterium]
MIGMTHSDNEPAEAGGGAISPDLILLHAALEPRIVQLILSQYWPDGDLAKIPPGFHEIPAVFPGLRAFMPCDRPPYRAQPDPSLLRSVREWVDALAQRWDFGEVFAAGGLNFWGFLRDRFIHWVHQMMEARHALERLAGEEDFIVLAAGISDGQRMLLRGLTELSQRGIRPEIVYAEVPTQPPGETLAERRFRKMFLLLQDAWHGMRFLLEDLFVRRPKVLLVSSSRCWKRRMGIDGSWARTDIHLEAVWREGRRHGLRLYYRSDSYHPDVGAMTAGRLAPTYLRHFLFLLAQTSRGFWETRSILRKWKRLRDHAEFQHSLVYEEMPLGEMITAWLDEATRHDLPAYVRNTRRETHFLRGIRPEAILMTDERGGNRSILAAANKLAIPVVALQLRAHQDWNNGYQPTPDGRRYAQCLPDRLCVFTQAAKVRLVEGGALDPSAVVVTGDPRLGAMDPDALLGEPALRQLHGRWGVERGQKVIAVACAAHERSKMLSWVGKAAADRRDAFLLMQFQDIAYGEREAYRQSAVMHGLRWFHLIPQRGIDEMLGGVDVMVTTRQHEVAEGVLRHIPVVHVALDSDSALQGPDPGDLIRRVTSEEGLREAVSDALEGCSHDERRPKASRTEFLEAVYGRAARDAGKHIVEAITSLMRRD